QGIRKQQIEVGKELDETNSKLIKTKQELDEKSNTQNTNVSTPKEKKDVEIDKVNENVNEKSNAGIIEAASVVVGSLKSKLNTTQKELEGIQRLLEEEREAHKKTRQELIKIKSATEENKKS
ncbi:MAG: DNA repair protein, partial [Nitrosopumilus sp.]|nr:DNA repair protein [Nitrosopumilus sp.]